MAQQLYESEIKSGGHGETFQRDIALSLLLQMRKSKSTVRMAYEMKMANKFDDIVLIDDTNEEIHLIQAKHADTSDGKVKNIDLEALFPTEKGGKRNGDFDLCKYAKSYLSVIQCLEPKAYKKMFYILTNKDLKQTENEWVKFEEREINKILRFHGSSARNLKLIPTEKAINEMSNNINKDFIGIKSAIKEFFDSGKVSQIFTDYCTPLKDVLAIKQKKCRFASNFNSEHENPNVAMLYTMLQRDQVNMEKAVTVSNNFLAKDSRNKMLPPYVSEDEIVAFFHDFILSVDQLDDLRPIIISELQAWMKTWIRPDILGQLRGNEFEQLYINLEKYFVKCNEPVIASKKRFLDKQDVENCLEEIRREWQTGVLKRIMAEAEEWEKTYINRHIKYEEVAFESTEGMDDTIATIEKKDIVIESEDEFSGSIQITDKNRKNTIVRQISDTRFVEDLRGTFQNQQHILLVADPGMGKTSLLQFLTFEVQKQNDIEVFLVYFSTLSKELDKREEVANLNDVRGILSAVLSEENCDTILNATEERNDKGYSIILALDAFDEMHSKYTVKVTSILELLSRKKSIQFIISSRIHVQKLLESKFDVKLIFLVPFSKEDQIRYLKKMWMKENVDEKAVENFSELLFKKIDSSISSKLNEISGLPLMMRMLAEIYSDRFDRFVSAGFGIPMEQFDLSEDKLNIVQLFEKFVSKCFRNKFMEKYKPTVDINDAEFNSMIVGYILEHQLLAIKLLDIEILRDLNPNNKEKYNLFKRRCETDSEKSILVKVVNNDVQFCHLSFGEYFVATYLVDHIYELKLDLLINVLSQHEVIRKLTLIKLGENENHTETAKDMCKIDWKTALWACETGSLKLVSSLKESFQSFSIDQLNNMLKVSAEHGFDEICSFLIGYNENLDKCTALHSAAKHGHSNVVIFFLKYKMDDSCWKDNGRTPLHIAACYGQTKIAEFLIENRHSNPEEADQNNWTALHYACHGGHPETVKSLIALGVNKSSRTTGGRTLLHIAAEYGHTSIVQFLIDNHHSSSEEVDENNWTALHYACKGGRLETVKLLMAEGVNISSRTISGQTPLHFAAQHGHTSVVEFLKQNHPNPNEVDTNNWTALHYACYGGHPETVKSLIALGVNISSRAISGQTPLHIAAQYSHTSVVELLKQNYPNPNEMDTINWTALHYAFDIGNLETVKSLIALGVDISSWTISGKTPLQFAAINGHTSIVKFLIESHHSNSNEVDEKNWTALHYACYGGKLETVKSLIALGVSISSRAKDGKTPLHMAALYGQTSIVQFLIENHHSQLNELDVDNWTALHYACYAGKLETVKSLIALGVSISSRTKDGKSPLQIAELYRNTKVVEFLKNNHPNPNEEDTNNWTALRDAVYSGNLETVKSLIDLGKNISSWKINGQTLLHFAALYGHTSIVQFLIENHYSKSNEVDEKNWTALHYACYGGKLETVKSLIALGVSISSRTKDGKSPLQIAELYSHTSVVEFLEQNHPNPNEVDTNNWTALRDAFYSGNLETVKSLIAFGENISSWTISGKTPLHFAAINGHTSIVKFLIESHHSNSNEVDENNWTALHYACYGGKLETVKSLIALGVSISSRAKDGKTPLHMAALYGQTSIVQFLIENHHSQLNEVDGQNWTALHYACYAGELETVKSLIALGVSISSRAKGDKSPLQIAELYCRMSVVEFLKQNHPNPNEEDTNNWTALRDAVYSGNLETVKSLIAFGENISSWKINGQTLLHFAALYGHTSIVKFLIENHYSKSNEVDEKNWTALHYACYGGKLETVKSLIALGVSISCRAKDGKTPLQIAESYRHTSVVEFLKNNHPNPNEEDTNNWTALRDAFYSGNLETVKSLIAFGENISSLKISDKTPLHFAASYGRTSIVKFLIENHYSKSNEVDEKNWTALHHACYGGDLETVKSLIALGVSISSRAKDGKTPLLMAALYGQTSIVQFLIENHHSQLNEVDVDNWTALHYACYAGKLETVKFLIALGVSMSSRAKDGKTPLQIAESYRQTSVVEFLKKNH